MLIWMFWIQTFIWNFRIRPEAIINNGNELTNSYSYFLILVSSGSQLNQLHQNDRLQKCQYSFLNLKIFCSIDKNIAVINKAPLAVWNRKIPFHQAVLAEINTGRNRLSQFFICVCFHFLRKFVVLIKVKVDFFHLILTKTRCTVAIMLFVVLFNSK